DRWLKAHKNWWNDNNVPQRLDAALTTGAFYTQAIGVGAAFTPYAKLPVNSYGRVTAAMLATQAQDDGLREPQDLLIAATQSGRIYVLRTTANTKVTLIPACEQISQAAMTKTDKAFDSDQTASTKSDAPLDREEAIRQAGDHAFRKCFAERAKKENFFLAA